MFHSGCLCVKINCLLYYCSTSVIVIDERESVNDVYVDVPLLAVADRTWADPTTEGSSYWSR